jgi:DNA-binding protein YbaB
MSMLGEQRIDELLAAYRETRAAALRTGERIADIAVSTMAPRRAVSVTVDGRGRITALEFPTHAYRRMAPAELSEAILGAVADARAQVLDKLAALSPAAGLLAGLVSPADLLAGQADLAGLLPEDPFTMPPSGSGDSRAR